MAKIKPKQKIRRRRVTFLFESSDAKEVILVGNFNNWNAKKHPMKSNENGMWNKSVVIPPGRYEYKFLVDRQWEEDPQNDKTCLNCFGTYNNVFNLTES
jgi:5'-AMP-activated protein kinase regulatory beta subunit